MSSPTRGALARLRAENSERHEAIHAIGSALMKHVGDLLRGDTTPLDPNAPYFRPCRGWREEFGMARKRIPPGTKLPAMLIMRERDIIRDETFCNPNFAKRVVAEGTGIRVELSLDEIEEIQGYVAAEADHTTNSKRDPASRDDEIGPTS